MRTMETETQEHKEMTTFEGTLKRAREGNALSQNLLGIWILNSQLPNGVEVNEDPFELIRLSAEQGFPTAQYNMGVIHETGCLGGKVADAKDEKLAFAWYRKAANRGCKSDDDDSVLMADSEASYKVLEGYVKDFLKELDESLLR